MKFFDLFKKREITLSREETIKHLENERAHFLYLAEGQTNDSVFAKLAKDIGLQIEAIKRENGKPK